MNKRHWIYAGPYGRHNKIGIMHDPYNGNLLIYYNDKVLQTDQKVFQPKSYKFFVDEELCEIQVIELRNGSFGYEFKFDYKAETKGNAIRKKWEKKWKLQGMSFLALFFGTVIIGSFVFIFFRTEFLESQLKRNGEYADVTMRFLDRMGGGNYETFYHYATKSGEKYSSKIQFVRQKPTTPHGLPIENGDVFKIKYASNNIFNHKIDFNQPSNGTAVKLMQRVAEFHLKHHQGRIQQELYCEIQAAYDVAGLDGLASIYHQLKNPETNPKYNKDTYLKLIRDTPFEQAAEDCWDRENDSNSDVDE